MHHLVALFIVFAVGGMLLLNSYSYSANSPKMQLKMGVLPEDILCKDTMQLVIKKDGSPLCVKPTTAEKLAEKGLAKIVENPKGHLPSFEDQSSTLEEKTPSKSTTNVPVTKPASKIEPVPAAGGSIVNFYLYDQDLNLNHRGFDTVKSAGLLEFFINNVPIAGPQEIIETEVDSGKFLVKIVLPSKIDGVPLSQNDVLTVRYHDQSDYSGNPQIQTASVKLQNSPSNLSTASAPSRIGQRFTLQIYEPDANLDSKRVDRIPLSMIEFRSDGGIRITLANPAFDANSSNLLETGPNTNLFTVQIEIPRQINGKTIDVRASYEFRYVDTSSPSETDEKVKLKGKLG